MLPCSKVPAAANILKKRLKEHIIKLISYYMNVNMDIYSVYSLKSVDGNIGVAKRVKFILEENKLLNNKNENGSIEFILTKKE